MKTKIKFLGLALLSFIIISTSCSKATDDKIEEVAGPIFTVNVSGGDTYKSTTGYGKMVASEFVITSDKGEKEIYLYIKKFEKGNFTFDDLLNHATFSFEKGDVSKIYTATPNKQNFVKITKIHTDGKTFDGEFNISCIDASGDIKVITGAWINLVKK